MFYKNKYYLRRRYGDYEINEKFEKLQDAIAKNKWFDKQVEKLKQNEKEKLIMSDKNIVGNYGYIEIKKDEKIFRVKLNIEAYYEFFFKYLGV